MIYKFKEIFFYFFHHVIPIDIKERNRLYRRLMLLPLHTIVKDPNGDLWIHISEKWWMQLGEPNSFLGKEEKGYYLPTPLRVVGRDPSI